MNTGGSNPTCIDLAALDCLMPMHVIVEPGAVITHTGPTIAKTMPREPMIGRSFFDVFEPRRQKCRESIFEACAKPGTKVRLVLRDAHRTPLTGTAATLPEDRGVLINLSFGIAVVDAVARYDLAGSDFAATDLTLEMLYLVEAKSAAMKESRDLNARLHGAKRAAEADAASDMLTGLCNRRVLDQVLVRKIRRGDPFTLMHLDLDYFKAVNDTLGHAAGDHVLTEVARMLVDETRDMDTVARVGGDEFVLIIDRITDPRKLGKVAARLIERLEEPIPFRDGICRISGSIGMVSSISYAPPDASRMMEDADAALYRSKENGRGRYSLFPPRAAAE